MVFLLWWPLMQIINPFQSSELNVMTRPRSRVVTLRQTQLDTNYHYIVPEFTANQEFRIFNKNLFSEYNLAKLQLGEKAKPLLLGPVNYLLQGKEKEQGFERIDLIKKLVPVYVDVIDRLRQQGAKWIQLDEPCLADQKG